MDDHELASQVKLHVRGYRPHMVLAGIMLDAQWSMTWDQEKGRQTTPRYQRIWRARLEHHQRMTNKERVLVALRES